MLQKQDRTSAHHGQTNREAEAGWRARKQRSTHPLMQPPALSLALSSCVTSVQRGQHDFRRRPFGWRIGWPACYQKAIQSVSQQRTGPASLVSGSRSVHSIHSCFCRVLHSLPPSSRSFFLMWCGCDWSVSAACSPAPTSSMAARGGLCIDVSSWAASGASPAAATVAPAGSDRPGETACGCWLWSLWSVSCAMGPLPLVR
mmetsp:Transcript_2235/g.6037  ORF Transcript_2235/g.6037 Transcript_2235/m.6037 type:complete len:201 (+) Transcript_2235:449-1051(+)